jgi:(p)ppGpp synthase/HD superfamily hydrolase
VNADESALVPAALAFALRVHAGQTRKGRSSPYASHLLQVAGLVLEHGGDSEQVAAALLHDSAEDSLETTQRELEARFGAGVAGIIADCSDTLPGDRPDHKSPWRLRKTRHLEHLARVDARSALVAGCDKLHNLRELLRDLRAEGARTFERFNAGAGEQLWYFEGAHSALAAKLPAALSAELGAAVADLRAALAALR